jgi:hypothetical protein
MNKKLLLERYPELIKEIAGELFSTHVQKTDRLKGFDGTWNEFVKAQTAPEWEVIELTTNTGAISTFEGNENQHLYKTREAWVKSFTESKANWWVYSVKRTSDGEIFKLGDHLEDHKQPITKININPEFSGGVVFTADHEICIAYVKKAKAPEWEILSYATKDNSKNITVIYRGRDKHDQYWDIHSVKRLSDGMVFTINDWVITKGRNHVRIQSITIDSQGFLELWYSKESRVTSYQDFATLEKRTPLFKTEDGVDVFKDEDYWYTNNEFIGPLRCNTYTLSAIYVKRFSTKESAENYVLLNRPLLSVQDILNLHNEPTSHNQYEDRIKELAKSKL